MAENLISLRPRMAIDIAPLTPSCCWGQRNCAQRASVWPSTSRTQCLALGMEAERHDRRTRHTSGPSAPAGRVIADFDMTRKLVISSKVHRRGWAVIASSSQSIGHHPVDAAPGRRPIISRSAQGLQIEETGSSMVRLPIASHRGRWLSTSVWPHGGRGHFPCGIVVAVRSGLAARNSMGDSKGPKDTTCSR